MRLLGSGAILNEVIAAQKLLEEDFGIAADVWSVTSYQQLRRNALETERWNRLHPKDRPRISYVSQCLGERPYPVVAASDYIKLLPDSIARFSPAPFVSLGTDGFGRSDTRADLRNFFEVDSHHIVLAALTSLKGRNETFGKACEQVMREWKIDPEKREPHGDWGKNIREDENS